MSFSKDTFNREGMFTVSSYITLRELFSSSDIYHFTLSKDNLDTNFLEESIMNAIEYAESCRIDLADKYKSGKLSGSDDWAWKYFAKEFENKVLCENIQEDFITPFFEKNYPNNEKIKLDFEFGLGNRFMQYLICNIPEDITSHITVVDFERTDANASDLEVIAYTDLFLKDYWEKFEKTSIFEKFKSGITENLHYEREQFAKNYDNEYNRVFADGNRDYSKLQEDFKPIFDNIDTREYYTLPLLENIFDAYILGGLESAIKLSDARLTEAESNAYIQELKDKKVAEVLEEEQDERDER